MHTLIRNTVSPKLMVAILAAASFVITPALSQADDDKDHKKTEHKMKKHDDDMKKMSHEAKEKAEKKEHEEKEKHEKHEDESDD